MRTSNKDLQLRSTLIADTSRRPARVVTLVAALLVVLLGIAVSDTRGEGAVDLRLDRIVILHFPYRQTLAPTIAGLGNPAVIAVLVLALIVVFVAQRRWAALILALVGPAVAVALSQLVLKPAVNRHLDLGLTFPSTHAAGTFAVATVAVIALLSTAPPMGRVRRWSALSVLVVATIAGLAIVAAHWHFMTDVVGGVAVGVGVVTGLALLVDLCTATIARRRTGAR